MEPGGCAELMTGLMTDLKAAEFVTGHLERARVSLSTCCHDDAILLSTQGVFISLKGPGLFLPNQVVSLDIVLDTHAPFSQVS